MSDVSELFRLNFPYTTVYPALGNLDLLENRERRARLEHGGVARISSVTSKGKQRRRGGRRRRRRKGKEEMEEGESRTPPRPRGTHFKLDLGIKLSKSPR